MPDRGDDGNGRRGHRPGDALAVERPQVLSGTAAATHDDDVKPRDAPDRSERGADLRLRTVALHARRDDEQLGDRPAALDHGHDVRERGRVGTRDDGDALRVPGERPLARRIEQAVLRESRLGLLERDLPQPARFRREQLQNGEAELPLLFPHRGPSEREDLHAVRGGRREAPVLAREHDAAELRRAVAQGEVPVTALPALEAGDLTAHPQRRQPGLDHRARPAGHLPHRPGPFGGGGGEEV